MEGDGFFKGSHILIILGNVSFFILGKSFQSHYTSSYCAWIMTKRWVGCKRAVRKLKTKFGNFCSVPLFVQDAQSFFKPRDHRVL